MSSESRGYLGSLIPSGGRELTTNGAEKLIRRGLADIAQPTLTSKEVENICSDLEDFDFDVRAKAAQAIVRIAPHLNVKRNGAEKILFSLVQNLEDHFERRTRKSGLFDCGEKYYPPNEEFKQLLLKAIEAVVGPIAETSDAIIYILTDGSTDAKIKAAEWLGNNRVRKAIRFLREADQNSSDNLFSLTLRYALSRLGEVHVEKFYQQLVHCAVSSSDQTVGERCREYLLKLCREVTPDTLGRSFCLLATHGGEANRNCAGSLMYEIMYRWLDDYSDDVLDNMIGLITEFATRENEKLGPYSEKLRSYSEEISKRYPKLSKREKERVLQEVKNYLHLLEVRQN